MTKGHAKRALKDPIFDAFGIGHDFDAIRGNQNITMLHRDNVWHPYWEVKTGEDDLGTKMRNKMSEKRDGNVEGDEITDLKATMQSLEKNQRED